MKVTVSEPQTEEPEKGSKFTSYLISFESSSSSSSSNGSVRRRYSDFQWLVKRLQTEKPGALVPVIPHERVVFGSTKKFDDDFIEERRKHLQEFLMTVVNHTELSRAPCMTPFMTLNLGEEFDEAKKNLEQTQPQHKNDGDLDKAGDELYLGTNTTSDDVESSPSASRAGAARRGLGQLFAKIRVSVGSKELHSTANESQVVALQEYIAQATKATKKLVKASDALTKNSLDTANVYRDISTPLDEWKVAYQSTLQAAEPPGGMVDAMSSLSEFATDFSTLLRRKHIEEQNSFTYTMYRLQNMLMTYRRALGQRKNWQVAYTATTKQIIDKEAALAKAEKNYKPPEVTEKIVADITALETRRETEKTTFEECTDRLLRDAELYKPTVESLLKRAFSQYAQIQLAYTDRVQQAFGQLLPYLEDNESGDDVSAAKKSNGGDDTTLGLPPAPPPNMMPPPPPPPITDGDMDSGLLDEDTTTNESNKNAIIHNL